MIANKGRTNILGLTSTFEVHDDKIRCLVNGCAESIRLEKSWKRMRYALCRHFKRCHHNRTFCDERTILKIFNSDDIIELEAFKDYLDASPEMLFSKYIPDYKSGRLHSLRNMAKQIKETADGLKREDVLKEFSLEFPSKNEDGTVHCTFARELARQLTLLTHCLLENILLKYLVPFSFLLILHEETEEEAWSLVVGLICRYRRVEQLHRSHPLIQVVPPKAVPYAAQIAKLVKENGDLKQRRFMGEMIRAIRDQQVLNDEEIKEAFGELPNIEFTDKPASWQFV